MNDTSNSLLIEIESAFCRIRDLIELNEALVEGEVSEIREHARGNAKYSAPSDEGSTDLIDALRNHQSLEWDDVTSTMEMALIRGRAEGASTAIMEISLAIQNWWISHDSNS